MKTSKLALRILLAVLAAAALGACATAPKEIPEDLSAQVLVQRAQEASDAYDYKGALAYYRALKERYGSDPAYDCAADYEMALIAHKQGRDDEAEAALTALLERYAQARGEVLPERYRILAGKVLENIAARKLPGK